MAAKRVVRVPGWEVAIKDHNVQGVLKTFMVELSMLLHDYDMQDSVFGDEVTKLMKSYEADMRA